MKTKASLSVETLPDGTSPWVKLYFEVVHLKQLYRQGWLRRGIAPERCESVAEHSFGVAVLALFLVEEHFPELDADKVLRLALLHDLGEIYAGDITPADGVDAGEKSARERSSICQVLGKLPRGARYVALWEEYEEGASPEARFVRQVDRLEMAFQASVYEHQGEGALDDFFASASSQIQTPDLRELLQGLESLRPTRSRPDE